MKILSAILSVVLVVITSVIARNASVEEIFKWKQVEYENLPKAENSWVGPYRYYIPENIDITSFAYNPRSGLILVSSARIRPGVPTSLGAFCVGDYKYGSSPKIWGFPNYKLNALRAQDFVGGNDAQGRQLLQKSHRKKQNQQYYHQYNHNSYYNVYGRPIYVNSPQNQIELKRIISVFHMSADEKCNRAFFMDNGMLQYYQNTTYPIQNPALWIIDLPADGCTTRNFPINRRVEFPDKIAAKGSNGFMVITPDYQNSGSCDDVFLYIVNAFFSFLTIYDYQKDKLWTFDHESFHPIISESSMIFDKTLSYSFPLGFFNLALGYPDENGDRIAYYAPMAGTAQFAVSTKVLKNIRNSPENYNQGDFSIMGYRGCGHQAIEMAFDYTYGVMFYTEAQSYQIRCWNVNKPLNPDNIDVVYESPKLLFGLIMFIDSRGYLWFHTDHIPVDFTTDTPLNLNQVNSRIFRIKVSDAIRGTMCENEDAFRLDDLYNDY